jgi:hypothetical protein
MARWPDLAQWRGPSPNKTASGQTEVRGLVVHIAAGWYEGTISWQRNDDSNISSHFIVGRNGQIAQMVDTADAAWTQRSGNGEWLSVECEGFTASDSKNPGGWERLSDAQIDAVARLLLRIHQVYGVPLQTTTSPTGRGLGHHSMGADWGHRECPGTPIIQQKPAIVAKALALKNGDDDMSWDEKLKTIRGQGVGYSDSEWSAGFMLASNHYYTLKLGNDILAEQKAARLREEAILAAVKGLDTKAVIAAVNAASAADAQRDAALLTELQDLAAGGATAEQIIDALAAKLAGRTE